MVEQLEGRRLLAGNVAVVVIPQINTVAIIGDNKSNELRVTGLFNATYTIEGLNGTTVNGQSQVQVPAAGPNGSNFFVSLNNGDDSIEFGNFVPGFSANRVIVETGNGDDTVGFHNVTAFNGLSIDTGNGEDDVTLDFVDIRGDDLNINTGNGEDTVTFGGTGSGVTVFDGDANINGGRGNDTLNGENNLHVLNGDENIVSF
jgi:hypothetical protein